MTHPGGRPLKFHSVEEMQQRMDNYFLSCRDDSGNWLKPISITGLALALDTSRETLMNYENRDEFFDTVKRAKLLVECFYEERLSLANATGSIFALKNFGWKDNQDLNLGGQQNNPVKAETTHKVEGPLADHIGRLLCK